MTLSVTLVNSRLAPYISQDFRTRAWQTSQYGPIRSTSTGRSHSSDTRFEQIFSALESLGKAVKDVSERLDNMTSENTDPIKVRLGPKTDYGSDIPRDQTYSRPKSSSRSWSDNPTTNALLHLRIRAIQMSSL